MSDDSIVKIMQSLDLDFSKAILSTKHFEKQIESLNKQLAGMKTNAMQVARDVNTVFASQLGQSMGNNTIVDQFGRSLVTVQDMARTSSRTVAQEARSATQPVSTLANSMNNAGTAASNAGTQFATSAIQLHTLRKVAKEVTESIKEIEMGMIEIQRVMTDSSFVLEDYRSSLLQLGVDYGQTFDNVQSIALRWAQSGYNVADSLKLTETSLLALNTAELNATQATEAMIGIMAQWNLQAEDMALVMDKVNITADRNAVTSQDLVDGLLRSSGAAKIMNLSLEETLGILTVMREASGRTGREVGNALNSILSYIQRPGSIKTLEGLGIDVFADAAKSQFRNVLDIFKDISANWNTLSADIQDGFVKSADDAGLFNEEMATALGTQAEWNDLQQRDVSQAAAGVYRRNYFIGLIERLSDVQGVLNDLTEAEGHSMRENAKTMETLEKKTQSLKTSMEALAVAVGETGLTEVLKMLVDAGTGAIEMFNALPDEVQKPILAFVAMSAVIKTGQLAFGLYGISVNAISTALGGLTTSAGAAANATKFLGLATNHWGLILAGAAAAGSLYYTIMKKNNEELERSIEVLQNSDVIDEYVSKYEDLATKSKLTTEEQQEFIELQGKIKSLMPEVASAIDSENVSLEDQLKIIKELNDQQREMALIQSGELIAKYGNQEEKIKKDIEANENALNNYKNSLNELLKKQAEGIELTEKEKQSYSSLSRSYDIVSESLESNKTKLEALQSAMNSIKGSTDENTKSVQEYEKSSIDLADTLNSLNEAFKNSSTDVKELNQIMYDVRKGNALSADTVLDLIEKYDLSTDAIKQVTDGYTVEVSALEDLRKAKIQTAIDAIEAEKMQSQSVMAEVSARLANYGLEIEQLKNLAEVKATLAREAVLYAQMNADQYANDNTYSDPYSSYLDSGEETINQALSTLKSLEEIEKRSKLLTGMLNDRSYGVSKTKDKKEEYKAIADYALKWVNAMEKVNNQVSRLKSLENLETNDFNKIKLLEKQNELLKEQQGHVHNLANAHREERDSLEKSLSKQGFKFDGEGDNRMITNMDHIKGKTKEVEEQFKNFIDLQVKEIPSASQQWWSLQESIVGNGKAITDTIQSSIDELEKLKDELNDLDIDSKLKDLKDQFNLAKFQNSIDNAILRTSAFEDSIDLLQYKLNLFDTEDFSNRAETLVDLFNASEDRSKALSKELEKLSNTTPKNAKEADILSQSMKQLQQQLRDSYKETKVFERALQKLQVDAISDKFGKATSQLELQMQILDNSMSKLQDGILSDFDFNMVMPIPDFSDIFAETASENERLYSDQKDYEEQIQELKKWSLDEQLKESKRFYQEEVDKQLKHYNELLKKIDEKNQEIYKLKEFANDEQKNQLDTFNAEIQQKVYNGNQTIIADTNEYLNTLQVSYENVWSSIVGTVESSVASIMSAVSSAKSAMSSIGSGSISGGSSSGGGGSYGGTSSSGESNQLKYLNNLIKNGNQGQKIWAENQKKIVKYAEGGTHPGGLALTGEEGFELGILPSGTSILLGKNGAELSHLPAGTQVIPHEESKEILSYTGNIDGQTIPQYKDGTIKTPNFSVEMSKQFKRGSGQYSEGMYDLLGFEGYDKYLKYRKKTLKEIAQLQADYLKGIDKQISKEEILTKIDEQLLEDVRTQSWLKTDLLEQMKSNVDTYVGELKDQYDKALASGNTELARQIFEEYNNMLSKQMQVENQINAAIKQRYDMEFALIDKKIAKEMDVQNTYNKQIEILKELYTYNHDGFIQHNESILQSEMRKLELIKQSSDELQRQLDLLEVGSNEWNIVNDRLEKVNDSILDSTLAIIRQNKEILRNKYDRELKNLENSIFGGMTQDEAREQLDDKINAQHKYVDGLEKELLIAKLLSNARKNNVALTAEELTMLNQAGKIERDKLDRLEKQLAIRILEQRIENLKNQKTIQQLAQKSDDTWDYTYVANQDAIAQAEEELKDAKLDLIKFDQEILNKQQREELDSKNKHFNKLKEVLDKSLRAEYETKEVFYNDLQNLVGEFLDFLDVDVSGSMENLFEMFELFMEKLGIVGQGMGDYKPPSSGSDGSEHPHRTWDKNYDGSHIDKSKFGFLNDYDHIQVGNTGYNMDAVRDNPELMEKVMKDIDRHNGYYIVDADNDNFSEQVNNAYTGKVGHVSDADALEAWKKKNGFATGGETQRTGWHWLDGENGEPERVLSIQQTKDFNKFTTHIPDLLKSIESSKILASIPNLLNGFNIAENIANNIKIPSIPNIQPVATNSNGVEKTINYHIKEIVFTDATTSKEIREAFLGLPQAVKKQIRTK